MADSGAGYYLRTMRVVLAASLILAGCSERAVPELRAPPADRIEMSGTPVRITGGKTIHLTCMGTGSPTVILTAGAGGSAADWREVQPQVATLTRVCAWDRLGTGLSSSSTGQETVADTTTDLVAALEATRIAGPFIVVGHSLGAYESLLLKDRAPAAVVAMVLVDPSIPDQANRLARVVPRPPLVDGQGHGPLEISARLVFNPDRNYGEMPIIVLTSTELPEVPPDTPDVVRVRAEFAALTAEMHRGHAELAALSARGVHRRVPGSGHYIQLDRPDAVISAIGEVLSATRNGSGL